MSPEFAADYERYSQTVYTLALRVTRSREAAEEITQDVFARRWSRSDSFDPTKGTLEGWLRLVCHSAAVAWVRREVSQSNRMARATRLDGSQISPEDITKLIADDVVASDAAHDLVAALDALSEIQRQALKLVYFDGLTHEEVAAALDIPLGTAKTRVRDGIRRLRLMAGEDELAASIDLVHQARRLASERRMRTSVSHFSTDQ